MKPCNGYESLLAAVKHDEAESPNFHDYRAKLEWVVERAEHYAERVGIKPEAILDAWEARRNYWYMNYYQDANQPRLDGERVRVVKDIDEFQRSAERPEFRCPKCEGVSSNPYECSLEGCDWKSYGFFGTLGKGVFVFVKNEMIGQHIFMPLAWESGYTGASNEIL